MNDGFGGLSLEILAQMSASAEMMRLISSMKPLNVNERALFYEALQTIYRRDCRRSRSQRPINRVEKITLKNIYQNRRVYASFDNNLPLAIRDDL
jgi:hypothetical protein